MTQKTIDKLITIQYICSVNVKLKEKLPGSTECVYILSQDLQVDPQNVNPYSTET